MTLQTFFDNFPVLVAASNGITRLRELIVLLAVTGRLSHPPANESSSLATNGERERLPVLPSGWCWVPLAKTGQWAIGSGFPKSVQGETEKPIPFCKVSDMNLPGNERFILATNYSIAEATAKKIRARAHPAGTVIFPKIGGAISTNKRRILVRPTAIDNNCLGIIPNDSCSTEWLHLILTSIDLSEYQSGTSVPALSQAVIGEIPVALPPLSEQKRIVAKVVGLMQFCVDLEAQQKAEDESRVHLNNSAMAPLRRAAALTPEEFEQAALRLAEHFDTLYDSVETVGKLRSTILQLAVQGKLVPQYAEDGCAVSLLSKNKKKRERLTNGNKSQGQVPLSENPFAIPSGWQWVPLAELGIFLGGGTPSKSNPAFWKGSIPWISPKDMKRLYIADAKDHISEEAFQHTAVRKIPSGSLLMVVRGMILAHSFPVALTRAEVTINQDMKALVFVLPEISNYVLLACRGLKDLMLSKVARSTHGTCRLETSEIELFPIPIPPLAEQERIVAKVDQLMALCDDLEAKLRLAEADSEKLMDAAVKHVLDVVAGKSESQREPALAFSSTEI